MERYEWLLKVEKEEEKGEEGLWGERGRVEGRKKKSRDLLGTTATLVGQMWLLLVLCYEWGPGVGSCLKKI